MSSLIVSSAGLPSSMLFVGFFVFGCFDFGLIFVVHFMLFSISVRVAGFSFSPKVAISARALFSSLDPFTVMVYFDSTIILDICNLYHLSGLLVL